MFEPPIYTIKSAGLAFGNNQLFRNVEFYINRGDKICLVGRNGCGKSTLLKVIAGKLEPDRGEIFIQPGTKVAYMPQDPDFSGFATLRDVVLAGLPADEHGLEYKADILIGQLGILEQPWLRRWFQNRTFCFWTSRPTISTCRQLKSLRKSSKPLTVR